jgi:hypothetical protein
MTQCFVKKIEATVSYVLKESLLYVVEPYNLELRQLAMCS